MVQGIKGDRRLQNGGIQRPHFLCDLHQATELNLDYLVCTLLLKNACLASLGSCRTHVHELFMENSSFNMTARVCVWVSVFIPKHKGQSAQPSPKHASTPSHSLISQVLGDSISVQGSSPYLQSNPVLLPEVALCSPLWELNLDPG